jgi:IS5 family transposase
LQKYGGSEASTRHISSIVENKAEKECKVCQKAEDKKVLADAKLQGKEAVAALRACIAQERAKASQARKLEKL